MRIVNDQDIKFLLKGPGADRPTPILIVFRYVNERFKTYISVSIHPKDWDARTQRALTNQKSRVTRAQFETINNKIVLWRSALKKVLTQIDITNQVLSNAIISEYLDKELGRTKPVKTELVQRERFTSYIERFVNEAKAGQRLTARSVCYAKQTLSGYMKVKRILEKYSAETGMAIDYNAFTLDFYHRFKLWLTKRGLTLNYVGTLLKDLKVMLKQSYADGMHTNQIFQHQDFKKLVEDVDNIYLTEKEIAELFKLDLTGNTRLDKARDLFLIGCYTGLRLSDFSQIRPKNVTQLSVI